MKISRSVGIVAVAVAFIFLTTASVAPRADDNLVALWHLDEASGPTVFDSSGNGNDGQIGSTTTRVPGLFGNALAFGVGKDYVALPASESLNVSASYTFEAWVWLPPWSANCAADPYQGLFRRGDTLSAFPQLEIYVLKCGDIYYQQGRLAVVHSRVWGDPVAYAYFTPVPRDTWIHLAVRWSGSGTPEAFYDGVSQGATYVYGTFRNPPTSPLEPSYIGHGYQLDDMQGMLDEVRLWDRALTDDEILLHASPVELAIDIKPGSSDNTVNLGANGVVPVAILTTDDFDASEVDLSTVTLAGAQPQPRGKSGIIGSLEDVDGDGDLDLVVRFPVSALQLTANDTEATLVGWTTSLQHVQGSDFITIVPRRK